MAAIDDKITEVMREMARRRWAKTTPEERKQYAQFLVSTRKTRIPKQDVVVEEEAPGMMACDGPEEDPAVSSCFRCESGYHERCLDNGVGGFLRCYCRRALNHQPV